MLLDRVKSLLKSSTLNTGTIYKLQELLEILENEGHAKLIKSKVFLINTTVNNSYISKDAQLRIINMIAKLTYVLNSPIKLDKLRELINLVKDAIIISDKLENDFVTLENNIKDIEDKLSVLSLVRVRGSDGFLEAMLKDEFREDSKFKEFIEVANKSDIEVVNFKIEKSFEASKDLFLEN